MKKPIDRKGFLASKMRKMDDGGVADPSAWTQTNQWATKNQKGISGAADFAGTTVDAFAPTDAYGVRSNGAALGSGALKGAASGAAIGSMFGPEGTLIGAGAGAIVGGVTGVLGNKKANAAKITALNTSTQSQLSSMEAGANARVAGDPSLKYGNQSASYYRFGGTMKGNGPTMPRLIKPTAPIQPKTRLMPNITEAPNRQMSKLANGGIPPIGGTSSALRFNSTKLFRPQKSYKSQVNQMENGGNVPGDYTTFANGGRLGSALHQHRQSIAQPRTRGQKALPSAVPLATQPPMPQTQGTPAMPAGMQPQQMAQMQQMMQQGNGLRQQAVGGKMQPLSSQDTKFNGPSHDNGGIKLPRQGVEVEGGETANKDFVFSKKLGYAQKHEQIAKAMGRAEQRPDTPINRATTSALQRKTELLKQQQEQHKAKLGIPNDLQQQGMPQMAEGGMIGDPPVGKKPVPKYDPTKQTTYNKTLLTNGKFIVSKPDGTLAQWGNPVPTQAATVMPTALISPKVIPLSDKANGAASTYYPANQQTQGKTPDVIPRSASYKFGGKMKRMDTGGNADTFPLPASATQFDPSMPNIVALNIPDSQVGTRPFMPAPVNSQTSSNNTVASVGSSKFNDIAGKLTPFMSNFVNATQRLPLPPKPIVNTEITPNLVNYSASRNEAVRQTRGADKTARETLNSGAAIAATKAANLAAQDRAIGQANETEQNTNAQIRNSASAENAQIRASNNNLTNGYQNELVARQLKQQQLASQNVANISEKLEGMKRDKSLNDLEAQKAVLGWMQNNNTGAGWEAVRPILSKYVSADALKTLDAQNAKMRQNQAQDREDNRKSGNYGMFAKSMNYDPKNMTPQAYQTWMLNNRGGNIAPGKTKLGTITDKEGNITYKTTE